MVMDATNDDEKKEKMMEPSLPENKRKNNDPLEHHLLYLPRAMWSPRYDQSFYTFQIESCKYWKRKEDMPTRSTATEASAVAVSVGGKTNFPAWYYQIVIYRAREQYSVWRRYSQFRWLYQELRNHPPAYHPPHPLSPDLSSSSGEYKEEIEGDLLFPSSGCPGIPQTDHFAQTRREQLEHFLDNALSRPGYGHHPAVQQFLELSIASDDSA